MKCCCHDSARWQCFATNTVLGRFGYPNQITAFCYCIEATRDKVQFRVTSAALDLEFSESLFTPEFLDQDVEAPEDAQPLRW